MKRLFTLIVIPISIAFTTLAFSCEKEEDPPVMEQEGDKGFGSSGSSGGSGCTSLTYNGPTNNVQIKTQCQLAQVYKCQGNSAGVQQCCENIRDLGGSCPYC